MFSTKSAVIISTCSAGVGFLIGQRHYKLKNDAKLNSDSDWFNYDGSTYVFPTASAESVIVGPDNKVTKKKDVDLLPRTKSRSKRMKSDPKELSNNIAETLKFGFPSYDNVRTYEDFILSYDKRNRIANWVLEHLTMGKVDRGDDTDRAHMKFVEDVSFHSFHRSTNKDFQGSGYDRGHLAAAANHRQSRSAMSQTFVLSNIAPQVGVGFNRDSWNNLEKYARAIARKNKNVYVCTGPLYLPKMESNGRLYVKYEVIGPNHVAVPTHFFKVLLIENHKNEKELLSFVMPNEPLPNIKLKNYLVPLETIERASGLHFFDRVPKNIFSRINTVRLEPKGEPEAKPESEPTSEPNKESEPQPES